MLLKVLGIIDLVVAGLLIAAQLGMPINRFYIIFVVLHAIKGIYFLKNTLSILDLLVVGYTIILPFWNHPFLTILAAGFLISKGAYSLI